MTPHARDALPYLAPNATSLPFDRRDLIATFLVALVATSLATALVFQRLDVPLTGTDDANIFFAYGRSLAEGRGLVFNPDGERVEGVTSLSWTVICALAFVWFERPEPVLLGTSVVLLAAGVTAAAAMFRTTASTGKRTSFLASLGFALVLLSAPGYVVWNTVALMDNALWSALLTTTAALIVSGRWQQRAVAAALPVLVVLLVVTRPESLAWVPALLLGLAIAERSPGDPGEHEPIVAGRRLAVGSASCRPALLAGVVAFLVAATAMTAFRQWYFGYPLPNTFYAKVSFSALENLLAGSKYLVRFCISDPVVCAAVVAAVVGAAHGIGTLWRDGRLHDRHALVPLWATFGLLVPVLTGGDHFGSFRFYQNIHPLLFLSGVYVWQVLRREHSRLLPSMTRRGRATVVAGIVVAFGAHQAVRWIGFQTASGLHHEFRIAETGRTLGAALNDLSAGGSLPSLGLITVGGTRLTYQGPIADLMGLTDLRMAHNHGARRGVKNHAAFETPTFFEMLPDLVTPRLAARPHDGALGAPFYWDQTNRLLKGLFDLEDYRAAYHPAWIRRRDAAPDSGIEAWLRREYLQRLAELDEFETLTLPGLRDGAHGAAADPSR